MRNWKFWSPNDFILLDCVDSVSGAVCLYKREGTQFMVKLLFFKKKKCSYLNNNSVSVWVMELLFPSLKEAKNCKMFLVLWLTQDPSIVFGTKQTCPPALFYAQFFPNMQYFPNHWSMQIFFTSGIDSDILMKVFQDYMYILYLGSLGFA